MANEIHPTAIVSDKAEIGDGNTVGPFAIVEAGAQLGDNNRIAAHAIVKKGVRMKNSNTIFEQAVIGGMPQHKAYTDETVETFLEIGSDNIIRESVTINCAWHAGESTKLGDGNFLMHAMHIGHDCIIGNEGTFGPGVGIGGHVEIHDNAVISGGVMIHQFVHIGRNAMIGGNSKITQDVLPFMITDGNPAVVHGLNVVGLKRSGVNMSDLKVLKQAYRLLFQGGSMKDNVVAIQELDHELTNHLCEFINNSERGFHRANKPS